MNLILADQSLENYMGHAFEYARSVGEHARGLGHEVTVLASRRVAAEVVAELGAVPCFRSHLLRGFRLPRFCSVLPADVRSWLGDEWSYLRHARTIRRDLCAIQPRVAIDRDTLVLFPTVGYEEIEPVVAWANRFPAGQCPWIGLVLHFTAYPDYTLASPLPHYYTRAFARMEKSPHRSRFRLFTDSPALAEEYQDYTSLPAAVVPIPHAQPRVKSNGFRRGEGALRLTYLGDSRRPNKGFQMLPGLFQRLLPQIELGRVRGEVQASRADTKEWHARLAARRLGEQPGVRLHDAELTSEGYYNLLERADVVLLPYLLDNYHSQTSGIFAEALAHGKPVVVPRGTWMAAELKTRGAGVTFLPGDSQSLYEACLYAVENHDQLRDSAVEHSARWRKRHCPATYLEAIINSLSEKRSDPFSAPGLAPGRTGTHSTVEEN